MKKILILCNDSNGLYLFRKELLLTFVKNCKVYVVAPDELDKEKIMSLGCRYEKVQLSRRSTNPLSDLNLLKSYVRIIKRICPDIVITYTIKPNVYGGLTCRLLHIPYAVNITGLGTAFQKKGALRTLVTMLYKVGLKRAKVVFFENCENQQIFIDNKIVPEKKTYLLNGAGVNLEHFKYQDYPMDSDEVRFLFVGRVMREKGINELFKAMRMLRKVGVNCSLDVVGRYEENYERAIKTFAEEGWLRYHGFQEDVLPFIGKCHCFILPSWHEGMANTNLECAASGRPVITSNIHGCLEAVVDGKSGFLCEKQNVRSLYTVMKRFTELSPAQRRDMGIEGRRHMEEVFDKEKVVEETVKKLF